MQNYEKQCKIQSTPEIRKWYPKQFYDDFRNFWGPLSGKTNMAKNGITDTWLLDKTGKPVPKEIIKSDGNGLAA